MQNYINYNLDIIINGLTGTNTAAIFTCIILLVFIIAFILIAFLPEKRAYIAGKTPGILTALGLVGTFLRIAQDFDSDLPALLENIKLSIWTAILGMFCAVIITLINYITGIFADDNNDDSEIMILVAESIEDSVNIMQNSMIEHSKKISGNIQSLGQGINHIAQLSQEIPKILDNGLKKIRENLQNHSGNIEIDFKGVESAVKKQVSQISEITAKLAAAGDSITKYTDGITDSLQKQVPQINESITQISALTQNLSKYTDRIPEISESITGILQAQSGEINALTQNLSGKILESLESNLTTQAERVGLIDGELSKQQQLMSQIVLNLESILTTGMQNVQSEFNKTGAQINNILNKNVVTLNEQTRKYLNNTLKVLADNLAAINKKIDDLNNLSGGMK